MAPITPAKIVSFTGSVSGGPKQRDNSLQVVEGTEVELAWTLTDADTAELTHGSTGRTQAIAGASGKHKFKATLPAEDFTLVAVKGASRSAPLVVHVSTHAEGDTVSHHAAVTPPRVVVMLTMQDADLKPRVNVKYTLQPTGADATAAIQGATNAAGELEAFLDGGTPSALLTLHANPDEVYPLVFAEGAPTPVAPPPAAPAPA